MFFVTLLVVFALQATGIQSRIYDKCTLAKELKDKYGFPEDKIPTWICIVDHESKYDTAAVNSNTNDYGLFQISQIYWCEPPAHPDGCHKPCDDFINDDIDDDVVCVKKIYDTFQQTNGDGFQAWTTYQYCQGNQEQYIQDCQL